MRNLEHWKQQEREHQEKINDDAKDLERMTNKQSLLLKKVRLIALCVCLDLERMTNKQSLLLKKVRLIALCLSVLTSRSSPAPAASCDTRTPAW